MVVEWGFSPVHLPYLLGMKKHGATLVWFDGDKEIARHHFGQREGWAQQRMEEFDNQVAALMSAGLPTPEFQVIPVFDAETFRKRAEIDRQLGLHVEL